MLKILDYLNKRDIQVNTLKGAKEAVDILLREETDRRLHSIAVSKKAVEIAKELKYENLEQVEIAGLLHDIGYSKDFIFADFHPVDGKAYLKANGWDTCYSDVALYHSAAEEFALEFRLDLASEYIKCPYEKSEHKDLIEIITIADFLTDSKGNSVSFEERLEGIRQRYGQKDPITHHAIIAIDKTEFLYKKRKQRKTQRKK